MNNYITLDGLRYKTPARGWQPIVNKPSTLRVTLLGEIDTTFGAACIEEWQGQIEGPVTPEGEGWGSIDDLRAALAKRQELELIDHYGNPCTVVCMGPFKEESFMANWDAPHNHINVTARVVRVR